MIFTSSSYILCHTTFSKCVSCVLNWVKTVIKKKQPFRYAFSPVLNNWSGSRMSPLRLSFCSRLDRRFKKLAPISVAIIQPVLRELHLLAFLLLCDHPLNKLATNFVLAPRYRLPFNTLKTTLSFVYIFQILICLFTLHFMDWQLYLTAQNMTTYTYHSRKCITADRPVLTSTVCSP